MLVLVLAAAGALGLALHSEQGLRWLLEAASRHAPGELRVATASGTLAGPMRLQGLRYSDAELELDIEALELDWSLVHLLHGSLQINRLGAEGLHLRNRSDGGPTVLPDLHPPLLLQVDDLDLQRLTLEDSGGEAILEVVRLQAAARAGPRRITLKRLAMDLADISVTAQGELEPHGDYSLDLQTRWTAAGAEQGEPFRGGGTLRGTLAELELLQTLEAPFVLDLEARITGLLERPAWEAEAVWPAFAVHDVIAGGPELQLRGTVKGQGDWDQGGLDLALHLEHAQTGPWSLQARLSQRRWRLWRIEDLLLMPEQGQGRLIAAGRLDLSGAEPQLAADGAWRALGWPLGDEPDWQSTEGRFQLQGVPSALQLDAEGDLLGPEIQQLRWQVAAILRGQHMELHALQAWALGGTARLAGEMDLQSRSLDLCGSWQDLHWPDPAETVLRSREGSLEVRGALEAIRFRLDAALDGPGLPLGRWTLQGQGDGTGLDVDAVAAELLDGTLQGSGHLGWADGLQWEFDLKGRNINPAGWQPDWPGSLDFALESRGRRDADGLQAEAALLSLDGRLRDQPVRGRGRVTAADERYRFEDVELRSGESVARIRGDLGETLDLDWQVDARDLGDLLPGAGGRLQAAGRAAGTRAVPRLQARLEGRDLRYQNSSVAALEGNLDVDLVQGEALGLELRGRELNLGAETISEFSLAGAGTTDDHRLEAELQSPDRRAALRARGVWQTGLWQGRVEHLEVTDERLGRWLLAAPAAVQAGTAGIRVEQSCLESAPSRICLQGQWQPDERWQGDLLWTELPLKRLQPLLPGPPMEWVGRLDGRFQASGTPEGIHTAEGELRLGAGSLRYQDVPVAFRSGSMSLQHGAEGARGDLALDLEEITVRPLRAQWRIPVAVINPGQWQSLPLAAEIRGGLSSLMLLELLIPELANARGEVDLAVDVGGRLGQPEVRGGITLADGSGEIPRLGLVFEDIRLQVRGDDRRLQVNGGMRSGPGHLDLEGEVQLDPAAGWPARMGVKGKRFEIANYPEAWVLAEPDLEIRIQGTEVRIEGEVHIPEATLEPRDLSEAVTPSRDVVIVSEERDSAAMPLQIHTRVRVSLGDQVALSGFGFSGRITGALLAVDEPGQVTRGTGEFQVRDGVYAAYGQRLSIQEGRVIFAGGPVNDPGLDVRAVREVGTIVAGVRVQGPVSEPVLSLYSVPSMTQENILSYLLIGRPVDQATGADGQLLLQAASSLGLSGGEMLAQRIGRTFGLDEVAIDGDAGAADAALVVGKYLSPRLYLSYGVGLFDALNVVRMRYRLTDSWRIEAETGTQTGADLLYTIER